PLSLVRVDAPPVGRRIMAPKTARAVRAMLEMAVNRHGTAPRAQIVGYRVAGKTGTAHKQENGAYAADKYVASFVGFAPASRPRLVIAVMIDEPSSGRYYGGGVAGARCAARRADAADRAAPRRRGSEGKRLSVRDQVEHIRRRLAAQGA